MKPYNPKAWYWHVGGNLAQAYSSAVGDFVPADDQAFLAWKADGTVPSAIASAAELGEVLAEYCLRPVNAEVLEGYKATHASKICKDANYKLFFDIDNRLRAVERHLGLNGSPADLAPGQAPDAVKEKM